MVMTYLNPLLAAGEHETLDGLREAGADGLIIPDLPAGAMPRMERLAADLDLAMSFLVAPNTSERRIEAAIAASTGFVYVVPLLGVTGARDTVAAGASGAHRDRSPAGGRTRPGGGRLRPEHGGPGRGPCTGRRRTHHRLGTGCRPAGRWPGANGGPGAGACRRHVTRTGSCAILSPCASTMTLDHHSHRSAARHSMPAS